MKLTKEQIKKLNNMNSIAQEVKLGDLLNGLLGNSTLPEAKDIKEEIKEDIKEDIKEEEIKVEEIKEEVQPKATKKVNK